MTRRLTDLEKKVRAAEREAYKDERRTPRLPWRKTDEELRTLARDVVTGRALCTNSERIIKSAFYIMTTMMDWKKVDPHNVAAFIGYMDSVVPGRAMNGYPIFISMGLLHKADVEAYDRHLEQMHEALR